MFSNVEEVYIKTEVSSDDEFLINRNGHAKRARYQDGGGSGFRASDVTVQVQRLEGNENDVLDLSKPIKQENSQSPEHDEAVTIELEPFSQIQRIKIPIMNNLISKTRSKIEMADASEPPLKRYRSPVFKRKKKSVQSSKKKPKARLYPCSKCDATFDTSSEAKSHSLEHEVQTRHKCDECGRYFNRAFSLKSHMRAHLVKEHKCPFCVKSFPMRHSMRRHLRVHKKTLECDLCKEMFHMKEQLIRHIRKHQREASAVKSEIPEKSVASNASTSNGATNDSIEGMEEFNNGDQVNNEDKNADSDSSKSDENKTYLRREDLNYPAQVAIINKMYKGRLVADICRIYNITPQTVDEIWNDRASFNIPNKSGLETAKYTREILDTRIIEWLEEQKSNNVSVTGKMMQETAESLAKEFGLISFNGDTKWLERFKKKYNILLKSRINRDYSQIAESKWKSQFFKETWSDARLGLSNDYIYTADEIGLYFNVSKGRTKKIMGKKFIQGNVKDRLSIFLCTNASGTDKKKLVVCGSEDPLIYSHRDPNTLPVTYIRHSEALFTTEIFEDYVRNWNRDLQISNKKAVLVLDRATIHTKLKFSHLKMVFVPWKTAGLVPIKNGIFGRFRNEFRKLLLEEVAFNVTRGIYRDLTCLEALHLFEKAWSRVPADVITRSFLETGYDVYNSLPKSDVPNAEAPKADDDVMLANMLKDYDVEFYFTDLANLDMYLTVEEELLTAQGTHMSVFGGNHKAKTKVKKADQLPIGTNKPESGECEVFVRKNRALEDLDVVRMYLQSNNTSYEMYSNFLEVENFICNKLQPKYET